VEHVVGSAEPHRTVNLKVNCVISVCDYMLLISGNIERFSVYVKSKKLFLVGLKIRKTCNGDENLKR